MSVADIGALHARYVRLTDRFKSVWTYHQFASSVFKNFRGSDVPYKIDFQATYDRIKRVSTLMNSAQAGDAGASLEMSEVALDRATGAMLRADDEITPSVARRFFERLKRQDEQIVQSLIKFYLYSDAVEGDRRDKIDFLFTRIGEDFMAERGEYWSRESLEFREKIIALVSILKLVEAPPDEVVGLIRAVRNLRDEIQSAQQFEELTERSLLKNARTFKHRLGDLYFHPDILMAIVELNVGTKNCFLKLYHDEERRIVEDSQKLLDHGPAIERNFGETNPGLLEEIARFRDFKALFDQSRADSNIKHDVITQLKHSMSNILSQLDRGLGIEDEGEEEDLPQALLDDAGLRQNIGDHFGNSSVVHRELLRIGKALDAVPGELIPEEAVELPSVRELRLEPWEIAAWQKLFERRSPDGGDDDTEELWTVFVQGAALRLKIDEEATNLAASRSAGVPADRDLLECARASLDLSKQLDGLFNGLLHEAVYASSGRVMHQLYRSRFRLLRGFSGLWLIYDHLQNR
jgi:hypothetical protein